MIIDYGKLSVGDLVAGFCCDGCCRKFRLTPKTPADSGTKSWYCDVCNHYNIGSKMVLKVGRWLVLRPHINTESAEDDDT